MRQQDVDAARLASERGTQASHAGARVEDEHVPSAARASTHEVFPP